MGNLNTYVQGSVWMWIQDESKQTEPKNGVQSSGRPVLIVSNNTFNMRSPSVTCLTITKTLNESPVHVPITLDVSSHIQCEQFHTVSKTELVTYKGMIPQFTLSTVKEKIKLHLEMNTDRSLELLSDMKNSIDELNAKAADGFGLQAFGSEMANMLLNIHNCFTYIKTEITKMQSVNIVNQSEKVENVGVAEKPVDVPENDTDNDGKRRNYTPEEIRFIIDESNSTDDIMKRFHFKKKSVVYSTRLYYRKKYKGREGDIGTKSGKKASSTKTGKKGKHRTYTDEDKQFIIDTAHSLEEIVERFGYTDRTQAQKMRYYFNKKNAEASQA